MPYSACWLKPAPTLPRTNTPYETALAELSGFPDIAVDAPAQDGDWYAIAREGDGYRLRGGATGVLYGAYRILTARAAGEEIGEGRREPAFALRMINHWDNPSGEVERGYAGRSLFLRDNDFCYDEARLRAYARLLASVGVNAISVNNVNVYPPADRFLTEEWLPKVKALADLFRPYGVRLILSVDFALPVTLGLDTADPLDLRVQAFWRDQTALVYRYVPDLCGYLVKADSEYRPGPNLYRRNHAQGANLLARALKPFGGKLIWRCFVYNCRQDWRDHTVDRPKAAYDLYAPLDGRFDDNVILQIKNGPYDFQVREPVSPLLYAMPRTAKAVEIQLAQEYTGHQIDLYYMPPMWKELARDLDARPAHICAVGNLGDGDVWTGHILAQANLFAYGAFAWQGDIDPEKTARTWIKLTFGRDFQGIDTLTDMLLCSREIYEQYTAPLGLCWMVNPNGHYGPSPEGYEFSLWGTYHRADRDAIGIDRSDAGTGFAAQYPAPKYGSYNDIARCPEELLLFFHRVRYDHVLRDGRTLAQRIYDDHFEGAERAALLRDRWASLKPFLPGDVFAPALEKFDGQLANAREWRDVVNTYIHRLSGIPDAQGRTIYD